MKVELLAWMRGAFRVLTLASALIAIAAAPVLADDDGESEQVIPLPESIEIAETANAGSIGVQQSASHIDPGEFVGLGVVAERVVTNRVFDEEAFPGLMETTSFEAVETATPKLKEFLANPFLEAQEQAGAEGGGQQAQTGTDPRDFGGKVMPYYRYTKLKNGMKTQDFTLFGMWAWSSKAALTYEIPFARYYDIRGTAACASLEETGECFGDVPGGGSDFFPRGFEGRGLGQIAGMGDSIFRMIFNFDTKLFGAGFLPGIDLTFPTSTEAVLGGQTFTAGPIFTFVWDLPFWPAPGAFFAMMNIFQIDVWKDPERDDVNRYLGRWFIMFPVQKSQKLYVMIEMQPVYDWEGEHFSFWLGPEFGKAFGPGEFFRNGGALYFKPGFGINPSADFGDREVSFEFGFRYFLNPTQSVMDRIGRQ